MLPLAGGVSSSRWLGCAPMPSLGSVPAPMRGRRVAVTVTARRSPDGRVDPLLGAPQSSCPVAPHSVTTWITDLKTRPARRMRHRLRSCRNGGVQQSSCRCLPAQPNEMRLSCGAKLEYSQMEFYNTGCGWDNATIEDGRRQLQALVRLRIDLVARIHPCPDPAPPRHRSWEAPSEFRRPGGPMLGADLE